MSNREYSPPFDSSDMARLTACYEALPLSQRRKYALFSLKIKNFREFNRIYGRSTGDKLLHAVYTYLKERLEADEHLAHLYASHFQLLIHFQSHEELPARIAALLRGVRDFSFPETPGQVYSGLGVYLLTERPVDFYEAQFYADFARINSMYRDYLTCYYEIYGENLLDERRHFRNLKKHVDTAIANGEFELWLQPKVDLLTGEVRGAEALSRWNHRELGFLMPGQFLPNLEETGLIRDMDLFLFEQVCGHLARWRTLYGKQFSVSTNLSQPGFSDTSFLKQYREIATRHGLPPGSIEIELLESIVLNQTEEVRDSVDDLHTYGFRCSLDDFGSGFSSYSVLSSADLDELKIDRSLFRDFNNTKEKTVIKHIIQTAHELGLATVAEGVESPDYVAYLKSLDCDYIQGFVFYRPMPVREFEARFVLGDERAPTFPAPSGETAAVG